MRDVILHMSMSPDGFVGSGQALFDQLPDSRYLRLVETMSFPSGIVGHVHRPQLD